MRQDSAAGKGWCSMQVAFGDCPEVLLPCLGPPSSSPSAGYTNTLRCKPQTASEALENEKTRAKPCSPKSGMLWESHQNEAGVTVEVLLISHSPGDIWPQSIPVESPLPGLPGSHSQRFSDGIEVSGRLAACWKMSEPWKPLGTQSFGHSRCQLCPCLCLQSPVLNPKDGFCRA